MTLRYKLIMPSGTYTYCNGGMELDEQVKWLLNHGVNLAELKIMVEVASA